MSRHAGRQMVDRPVPALSRPVARRAATGPVRHDSPAESYGDLAELQRSIGNRATVQLLDVQTKLTVGAAEDAHELEADAVARQVVERLRSSASDSPTPAVHGVAGSLDEPEPLARRIQRRAQIGTEGGDLDDDTASSITSAMGGGRPLESTTRQSMESAFGADFGQVRVHTGETSTALNRQLQASAFTVGRDIFFRSGVPDAASDSGRELLAHELTHVVQQGGAP
jgi:hypothetical protein